VRGTQSVKPKKWRDLRGTPLREKKQYPAGGTGALLGKKKPRELCRERNVCAGALDPDFGGRSSREVGGGKWTWEGKCVHGEGLGKKNIIAKRTNAVLISTLSIVCMEKSKREKGTASRKKIGKPLENFARGDGCSHDVARVALVTRSRERAMVQNTKKRGTGETWFVKPEMAVNIYARGGKCVARQASSQEDRKRKKTQSQKLISAIHMSQNTSPSGESLWSNADGWARN